MPSPFVFKFEDLVVEAYTDDCALEDYIFAKGLVGEHKIEYTVIKPDGTTASCTALVEAVPYTHITVNVNHITQRTQFG